MNLIIFTIQSKCQNAFDSDVVSPGPRGHIVVQREPVFIGR